MRSAIGHRFRTAEAASPRAMLAPLAMAQFIASYDTSSMNVAISDVAADLGTTITAVQTAMTLFTLVMAAGMITGSRLTDILGRRICFQAGVALFGLGALMTALSPSFWVLLLGWSVFEGVGSALMIPPIYILISVSFDNMRDRAKAFGLVSAMAGAAAAAGPLIGGFFATFITWRASFGTEVLVTLIILYLSLRIAEPPMPEKRPSLDVAGAILSAGGLVFFVLGILQSRYYGWGEARQDLTIGDTVIMEAGGLSPVWIMLGVGVLLLALFALQELRRERQGKDPLVPMRLFKNRVSNRGLITQTCQWFMMIGTSFVVSVFLQVSQGYSAIETGLVLAPSTVGLLLASALAGRFARRRSQRTLVSGGFLLAETGIILLLLMVSPDSGPLSFVPGLFLLGAGAGVMVTASVNVVQSAVPEEDQGAISGVSRSVSNLGSSLGTAIAGSVLVAGIIFRATSLTEESTILSQDQKNQVYAALDGEITALSDEQIETTLEGYPPQTVDEVVRINASARDRALGLALVAIAVVGVLGLVAALLLPGGRPQPAPEPVPGGPDGTGPPTQDPAGSLATLQPVAVSAALRHGVPP